MHIYIYIYIHTHTYTYTYTWEIGEGRKDGEDRGAPDTLVGGGPVSFLLFSDTLLLVRETMDRVIIPRDVFGDAWLFRHHRFVPPVRFRRALAHSSRA